MASNPRVFAERYVEITNAGQYDRLATLFAEDAEFLTPDGRVIRGRDQIAAFYGNFLPTITPTIRLASFVEQGDVCVYELEARIEDETEFRLGAIDHATLDADGLVVRFAVYTKGGPRES
jgi:ketosteroid isomerase-like protein